MYKVIVDPQAAKDIETACDYYFSLPIDSNKLITNFITDIQQSIDSLSLNPHFAVKSNHFRGLPLKKFPYILFFEILPNTKTVRILSIFNTNQDTNKYPK